MSLDISIENGKVLLLFFPEMEGPKEYLKLLEERECMRVYNTFAVSKENVIGVDGDDVVISIGVVDGSYNRISGEVLGTKRDYCFDNAIKLGKADFIGVRRTSVLRLLDSMLSTDSESVYIDTKYGELDADNHIVYSDFRKFQKVIPHEAELSKYIRMRAATVFSGIFPKADDAIEEHNEWLKRVETIIQQDNLLEDSVTNLDYFHALDYNKLMKIRDKLIHYVDNCDAYTESTFQKAISEIVCFIFPKYLYSVREVKFRGLDTHEKQPDFVLIDYNGMIDFMEIKKPSSKLINVRKYRNNYSPSHEMSGAAQQVGKYIACIQRYAEEFETKTPKKIAKVIPKEMQLKVINPQGIIVMGDARGFSPDQKKDFELIKRQYKHVAEIITYDDLLSRLDNMIIALKTYADKYETE